MGQGYVSTGCKKKFSAISTAFLFFDSAQGKQPNTSVHQSARPSPSKPVSDHSDY